MVGRGNSREFNLLGYKRGFRRGKGLVDSDKWKVESGK